MDAAYCTCIVAAYTCFLIAIVGQMRDNFSLRKVDPDVSSLAIQLWLLNLVIVFSMSSLCSQSLLCVSLSCHRSTLWSRASLKKRICATLPTRTLQWLFSPHSITICVSEELLTRKDVLHRCLSHAASLVLPPHTDTASFLLPHTHRLSHTASYFSHTASLKLLLTRKAVLHGSVICICACVSRLRSVDVALTVLWLSLTASFCLLASCYVCLTVLAAQDNCTCSEESGCIDNQNAKTNIRSIFLVQVIDYCCSQPADNGFMV